MENKDQLILIIDDEEDIVEFVSYNLRKEGYKVITANNAIEGIQLAKERLPKLIILDVVMPGMDGIETCILLRQEKLLLNTVITFLTSRSEDYSLISGLEAGADDYIIKPIRPRVLISKINSLLRHRHLNIPISNSYQAGDLIVDPEKHLVYMAGNPINMPKKEFQLLSLLASKPNKVFTRTEIFNQIWHDDAFVDDKTINVHIRKIREKLGTDNIKTIKKVGYKYELK